VEYTSVVNWFARRGRDESELLAIGRRLLPFVALAMTACAGPGNASGSQTPAPAANHGGTSVAESSAATEAADAPSPAALSLELSALQEEYKAAERSFWDSVPRRDDGAFELSAEDSERMPSRTFPPRFQSLAERARGTPVEVDALLALLDIAGRSWWPEKDTSIEARAVQALLERHGDSPRMAELADRLRHLEHVVGAASVDAGLAGLADSPHAEVRALALKAQAERLLERDGTEAGARALLERLQREHPGSEPAQEAEGLLFKLDHLRVGLVAPDQEAVDQHGETFRLSDYRGKVVLLVFWGFW